MRPPRQRTRDNRPIYNPSVSPRPEPAGEPPARAYVAWVAICVIWGTTYLAIRIGLETMPPALMAGLRWLAAGCLLTLVQRLRGDPLPDRRTWPGLAVGFTGIIVLVWPDLVTGGTRSPGPAWKIEN